MPSSKSNVEYWRSRLSKRKFRRPDGTTYLKPDYEVRLSIDGRRVSFDLQTPNKEKAAYAARDIWECYRANGAEETLARFKPEGAAKELGDEPTVGDLIAAHEALQLVRPKTLYTYRTKFRTLVAGVMKIKSSKDIAEDGQTVWSKKVDSVYLKELTPQRILQWRTRYLKAANDPLSRQSATRTIDSVLRNSRSLYSRKALQLLPFDVPGNPFEKIPVGSASTRRYKATIDFKALAEAARDELRPQIPNFDSTSRYKSEQAIFDAVSKHQQFKILMLGLGCGLRRGEIDTLLWQQIDFDLNQITVEVTEYASTKSEESTRVVDVDPTIIQLLDEYRQRAKSPFVINSDTTAKPDREYYYYRCKTHFKRLINWLNSHGVTQKNALHELRKEYGSRVCQQFGIYAASQALGHSHISITAASYLDKKQRTAVKLF